jgi:hypothetical protein
MRDARIKCKVSELQGTATGLDAVECLQVNCLSRSAMIVDVSPWRGERSTHVTFSLCQPPTWGRGDLIPSQHHAHRLILIFPLSFSIHGAGISVSRVAGTRNSYEWLAAEEVRCRANSANLSFRVHLCLAMRI